MALNWKMLEWEDFIWFIPHDLTCQMKHGMHFKDFYLHILQEDTSSAVCSSGKENKQNQTLPKKHLE
jgi:hypothetical protein